MLQMSPRTESQLSVGPWPACWHLAAGASAEHERTFQVAVAVLISITTVFSVSNFSAAILPKGLPANFQQVVTLLGWASVSAILVFVRPLERVPPWHDSVLLVGFLGFAIASFAWSGLSIESASKALALAITTIAAYLASTRMTIHELVAPVRFGLFAICGASIALVVFAPDLGVMHTWFQEGLWAGVFETKQSLGSAGAFLMFLSVYRPGRGARRFFCAVTFGLGAASVIGAGSRGGGALALVGMLMMVLCRRSDAFARIAAVGPLIMTVAALVGLTYFFSTGLSYVEFLGEKVDLTERTFIWEYVLRHFEENALFGSGLNGFWTAPDSQWRFMREHGWVLDNYHNGYLGIVVETGIVGATLFTLFVLFHSLRLIWISTNHALYRSDVAVLLGFINLVFAIDFTETFFLRSTNFVSVLLTAFFFVACRPPLVRSSRKPRNKRVRLTPDLQQASLGRAAALMSPALLALSTLPLWALSPLCANELGASAVAQRMGRGVNILGYDGIWDGHVDSPFKAKYFDLIREAGFQHVRINLHAFKHMDATNRLSVEFLRRIESVVEQAIRTGLIPVLDEHDFGDCQRQPVPCTQKVRAFWSQMTEHFGQKFPELVYEILNEPGGQLKADPWNALVKEVLAMIRRIDPGRTVVVAAINSEDPLEITRLELPSADRNIIVTVHYYKPIEFTHQGAPWSAKFSRLRNVRWGTDLDKDRILRDLQIVADWAKQQDRPVYLGEFGVYEAAGANARADYVSFVARTAEKFAWPWAYWQFDHDFALFDPVTGKWVTPILNALVPGSRAGNP